MQYCSLQHWILPSSPEASISEHRFCFGPAVSFFLGLLVVLPCSPPVTYWTSSNLGDTFFNTNFFFCPFIQFMRFSQQVYEGGLPIPSPVDHILSELSTMTCPSWVTLHDAAHSVIELCKPLCHKAVIREGRLLHLFPSHISYCLIYTFLIYA